MTQAERRIDQQKKKRADIQRRASPFGRQKLKKKDIAIIIKENFYERSRNRIPKVSDSD